MRKIRNLVLVLMAAVLLLIGTVNYLALGVPEAPPPDPGLPIQLPNGQQMALGELLANQAEPVIHKPGADAVELPGLPVGKDGGQPTEEQLREHLALLLESIEQARTIDPDETDLFRLAEYHRHSGDPQQALALYRSIPRAHPQYGRAQRRIGWHLYGDTLDRPALGVPYVHRALHDNPTDGNAWQDAARVYLATLGLDVD